MSYEFRPQPLVLLINPPPWYPKVRCDAYYAVNFSCATRGCFSNVTCHNVTFSIFGQSIKKATLTFLKVGLAIKLKEKCVRGLFYSVLASSYYNWSLLRTQAGGLRRFFCSSTTLPFIDWSYEIGHGQSFGAREHRRGVGILNFWMVAMEIRKCGLWASVWAWKAKILQPGHLKMWKVLTHKFFGHLDIFHFWSISMETVKNMFSRAEAQKQWYTYGKLWLITK